MVAEMKIPLEVGEVAQTARQLKVPESAIKMSTTTQATSQSAGRVEAANGMEVGIAGTKEGALVGSVLLMNMSGITMKQSEGRATTIGEVMDFVEIVSMTLMTDHRPGVAVECPGVRRHHEDDGQTITVAVAPVGAVKVDHVAGVIHTIERVAGGKQGEVMMTMIMVVLYMAPTRSQRKVPFVCILAYKRFIHWEK